MFLKSLSLQNFRNYDKSDFNFTKDVAVVIGKNTAGKTNLVESIFYLSTGRGSKAEKEADLIRFGESTARISGELADKTELSFVVSRDPATAGQENHLRETIRKKYLVNGVAKRRADFAGHLVCVLFSPEDLDIITSGPSLRRRLLDDLLEQVDRDYRNATISYTKALRQRNALLDRVRESGIRNEKLFEYWDNLLIDNATVITKKREEFVQFINDFSKEIFDFIVYYDKSVLSAARLLQYKDAEVGAGVTLVGPHRDDLSFSMFNPSTDSTSSLQAGSGQGTTHDIKTFGSRGQQRLTILQLKIIELAFIEKTIGQKPILILDDIFSELDAGHIKLVLDMLGNQQSIVTTTHKEFVDSKILKNADVIELKAR